MVDGEPATAEVYSGFDPRGNPTNTLRLIEIRAGPIGWLLTMACPTAEWNRWKADFAILEHGLRYARIQPDFSFTAVPAQ